jgi:hypothetical protein
MIEDFVVVTPIKYMVGCVALVSCMSVAPFPLVIKLFLANLTIGGVARKPLSFAIDSIII